MYLRNCCTCVFVWKIGEFICKCSEKDKSQIFSQITIHHILLSSSYPSGGSKEPLLAALSIARVVPKYPKMFRYVGIRQTLYNRPLPGCIVGGWYGHWPYICLHFSVESIKVLTNQFLDLQIGMNTKIGSWKKILSYGIFAI